MQAQWGTPLLVYGLYLLLCSALPWEQLHLPTVLTRQLLMPCGVVCDFLAGALREYIAHNQPHPTVMTDILCSERLRRICMKIQSVTSEVWAGSHWHWESSLLKHKLVHVNWNSLLLKHFIRDCTIMFPRCSFLFDIILKMIALLIPNVKDHWPLRYLTHIMCREIGTNPNPSIISHLLETSPSITCGIPKSKHCNWQPCCSLLHLPGNWVALCICRRYCREAQISTSFKGRLIAYLWGLPVISFRPISAWPKAIISSK